MKIKGETVALCGLLLAACAIGLFLRGAPPTFGAEWVYRDLDRAAQLLFHGSALGLAGPESQYGGQLPGPYFHILLGLPLLIWNSFEAVQLWNLLLNCVAVAIVSLAAGRYLGLGIGLVTAILLLVNPILAFGPHWSFNPSWIFILHAIVIWLSLAGYYKRSPAHFVAALLVIIASLSVHMSTANFIVPTLMLWILVGRARPAHVASLILGALLILSPYLYFKLSGLGLPSATFEDIRGVNSIYERSTTLTAVVVAGLLLIAVASRFTRMFRSRAGEEKGIAIPRLVGGSMAVLLSAGLIWFSLPTDGYIPYRSAFRALADINLWGNSTSWFYVQGIESDLRAELAALETRFMGPEIAILLATVLLIALVGLLPLIVFFLGASVVSERIILASFLLFPLITILTTYLGGLIANPHPWYYFHLAIPFVLLLAVGADALKEGILWGIGAIRDGSVPPLSRAVPIVGIVVLALGTGYLSVYQVERTDAAGSYRPSADQVGFSHSAARLQPYLADMARRIAEEAEIDSDTFVTRVHLLSRTDIGMNHILFDAQTHGGAFRGYGLLAPERPAFYHEDAPCLFIEMLDRATGAHADQQRARLSAVIEPMSIRETESLRITHYRPTVTDYCFVNTRLNWAVTPAQRTLRLNVDPARPVVPISVDRTEDGTIVARYALFVEPLHLPLLLDLDLRPTGAGTYQVKAALDSEIMAGRTGMNWGQAHGSRAFKNARIDLLTDAGAQTFPFVRDPAAEASLFSYDRGTLYNWPGYFPILMRRTVEIEPGAIRAASLRIDFQPDGAARQSIDLALPLEPEPSGN